MEMSAACTIYKRGDWERIQGIQGQAELLVKKPDPRHIVSRAPWWFEVLGEESE